MNTYKALCIVLTLVCLGLLAGLIYMVVNDKKDSSNSPHSPIPAHIPTITLLKNKLKDGPFPDPPCDGCYKTPPINCDGGLAKCCNDNPGVCYVTK